MPTLCQKIHEKLIMMLFVLENQKGVSDSRHVQFSMGSEHFFYLARTRHKKDWLNPDCYHINLRISRFLLNHFLHNNRFDDYLAFAEELEKCIVADPVDLSDDVLARSGSTAPHIVEEILPLRRLETSKSEPLDLGKSVEQPPLAASSSSPNLSSGSGSPDFQLRANHLLKRIVNKAKLHKEQLKLATQPPAMRQDSTFFEQSICPDNHLVRRQSKLPARNVKDCADNPLEISLKGNVRLFSQRPVEDSGAILPREVSQNGPKQKQNASGNNPGDTQHQESVMIALVGNQG